MKWCKGSFTQIFVVVKLQVHVRVLSFEWLYCRRLPNCPNKCKHKSKHNSKHDFYTIIQNMMQTCTWSFSWPKALLKRLSVLDHCSSCLACHAGMILMVLARQLVQWFKRSFRRLVLLDHWSSCLACSTAKKWAVGQVNMAAGTMIKDN